MPSHCDSNNCSLTSVHCFNYGDVGKQPVTLKEYCAEYWLKELIIVFGTGLVPPLPLSIVLIMVMWESSQWLGNNIMKGIAVKRTPGKHG